MGILGISSSRNDPPRQWWLAATGATGVGAYVLPSSAPWFVVLNIFALVLLVTAPSGQSRRMIGTGFGIVATLLVLNGTLSAPLAVTFLTAAALAADHNGRGAFAAALLLMQMSTTATLQEILSAELFKYHIETGGPAIIATIFLLSAYPCRVGWLAPSLLLVMLLSWMADSTSLSPMAAMILAGSPIVFVSGLLAIAPPPSVRRQWLPFALLLGFISTWMGTPPAARGGIFVLLPNSTAKYEETYFQNYIDALQFAGIKASLTTKPDSVPEGATLLLPWLTEALPDEGEIKRLARERKWTVILGGEHSNMGGVAERVEHIVGLPALRHDLTTPPGNSDQSGQLRILGIQAWPFQAILNRGASVTAFKLSHKVLLSGDGWWAEPDIGEWLWAGDYVWQRGDRRGRLGLAVAIDDGEGRFIIVGDNSPLMNRQVIADPRPLLGLLDLATLWPTFGLDMFLALVGLLATSHFAHKTFRSRPTSWIPASLVAGSILTIGLSTHPSQTWKATYVAETGFDSRNFNITLAEEPRIWKSGWALRRFQYPVSGILDLTEQCEAAFLLVDSGVTFGDISLRDCRRLGSLSTDEGATLMDAQVCAVKGNATILLGDASGAAAIGMTSGNRRAIVILDVAFLSQLAPTGNREWLLRQMEKSAEICPH